MIVPESQWVCAEHPDETAALTFEDMANIGTPVCAECGDDMDLLAPVEPARILYMLDSVRASTLIGNRVAARVCVQRVEGLAGGAEVELVWKQGSHDRAEMRWVALPHSQVDSALLGRAIEEAVAQGVHDAVEAFSDGCGTMLIFSDGEPYEMSAHLQDKVDHWAVAVFAMPVQPSARANVDALVGEVEQEETSFEYTVKHVELCNYDIYHPVTTVTLERVGVPGELAEVELWWDREERFCFDGEANWNIDPDSQVYADGFEREIAKRLYAGVEDVLDGLDGDCDMFTVFRDGRTVGRNPFASVEAWSGVVITAETYDD